MVLAGLSLAWRRQLLSLWGYHSFSGDLGTHFLFFSKMGHLGDRLLENSSQNPHSMSALLLELHWMWSPAKFCLVWELIRPCYTLLTPEENNVLQFCKTSQVWVRREERWRHLDSPVFLVSIENKELDFEKPETLAWERIKWTLPVTCRSDESQGKTCQDSAWSI